MIQLSSIGMQFFDQWILKKIDLFVKKGESIVILGMSGSGKSVLLKIISGLLTPTEGTVQLSNQNLGMLFQQNALFDSLTVEENLLFPLKEKLKITGPKARSLASEFLEAVGLSNTQKLRPSELSGGMQKRLGIARALIVEPEIILYDEPTAGLDPITSRMIAQLIIDLQKKHQSTLVTVTNDVRRAQQLGDQIYLLAEQSLISAGNREEILDSKNPYIKQFVRGALEGPFSKVEGPSL